MKLTPYPLLVFALIPFPLLAGETAPKAPVPLAPPPPPSNPLSFAGGKVVLDIQERLRFEARDNNFDFNDGVDALTDDEWLLQRFRLGLKVAPMPGLTFYAQGQDVRELDSDRPNTIGALGAEGDDNFDLRQGWIEVGDPKKLSFKLGRQLLAYGDERLIGPVDWQNQGRTFDAAKLHYEQPSWSIDAFTSSVVRFHEEDFNRSDWLDSDATRDQFFSGIYFSTTALGPQTTDVYLLQLHEEAAGADTDFWTLGTRMKGDAKKLNGWDYELETAAQLGDVKGKDLTAFAAHGAVGYQWTGAPWKPKLAVEYNYATGDDNAKDGDVETFQNLFPTNHKFYGYMDVFSWQNVHNPALTLTVQPFEQLTARLDYHFFWLAETGDAWYRANGVTQVRPVSPAADSFAGNELDVLLTWKPSKNFTVLAGYSHFFAGDYLDDTGAGDDADFAYASLQIDF